MLHPNPPYNSTFSSPPPTQQIPPPHPSFRPGPGLATHHSSVFSVEPRDSPSPHISQHNKIPVGALARNDEVAVLINGRGWAIGIIIAVLEALDSYAGLRYTVRFTLPGEQKWQLGNFNAADIRPKNNSNR